MKSLGDYPELDYLEPHELRIGPGWLPLVARVARLGEILGARVDHDGLLSVDMIDPSPAARAAADAACADSQYVCPACGAAKVRQTGWVRATCEACGDARDRSPP